MTAVSGVYTAMWNAYLNDELKYTSISPFTDLNDQTFRFWNFSHVDPTGAQKGKDVNGNIVLYTAGDLAATMALNPDLKVFSANGYYDSVTPFFQTAITLAAMPLANDKVRANITVRDYPSGHMVYLDGPSRTAMKADLSVFYAAATTRFVAQRRLAQQLQFCHPYVKFPESGPGVLEPRATPQHRWSAPELCQAYQWPTGLAGGGIIGIIELGGGWIASDMEAYFKAIGQPMPTITDVPVNGNVNAPNMSATNPGPDAEVTLDIQIAAASYFVATGHAATIRVYWCGNDPSAIAAGIRAAASDGCDTCSISWGADEAVWQQASQQLGQDLPAMLDAAAGAATQAGMVIFAAAGDNDSSDGGPDPANVDLPSSSPHVVGCGGTRKTPNAETVWNDSPGNPDGHGTGGGFSQIFQPQPWEAGAPHGPGRMVPDVAANADPETGYEVVVHGQGTVVGGTSAVAPLYAGLFAAFGRKLGFVNATLWSNHLAFNDITQGDNGHYRARIGPDPCTGIGSPIGGKLAKLFAAAAAPTDQDLPAALDALVPPGWSGVVSLTYRDGHLSSEERELATLPRTVAAKRRGAASIGQVSDSRTTTRLYPVQEFPLGFTSLAVSSPISSTARLCVSHPIEIRSTPVAAMSGAVVGVIRPDASVSARPATIATARCSVGTSILSSDTASMPTDSAASSWSSVSTSTSTFTRWPTWARALAMAVRTSPAMATWLSLISTASFKPNR